jgi:phosphonate transport system substrate-binding protein
LRKKSVTFTSPSSFSGFKFAVVVLQNEFGMRLGRDYEYRFSTSHDESIRMIAAGEQDAATVASDLLSAAYERGLVQPDQIREIYDSAPFPAAAFGLSHQLAPDLAEKIRTFLVECDLSGTPIGSEEGTGGKLAATNYREEWQAVRDVDAAIASDEPAPIRRPAAVGLAPERVGQRTSDAPADKDESPAAAGSVPSNGDS